MKKGIRKNEVTGEEVEAIIEKFSTTRELIISEVYHNVSFGPLLPRLGRAALNQVEPEGDAVFSRYAIWANDARDMLIEAARRLERGNNPRDIMPLLIEVANSLSAFSDMQSLFDPIFHGSCDERDP